MFCVLVPVFALLLAAPISQARSNSSSTPATPFSNAATVRPPHQSPTFFKRLASDYHDDWFPAAVTTPTPAPKRRGFDDPLDSTPLPGTDYSVGGTPVIGAPDTQSAGNLTYLF